MGKNKTGKRGLKIGKISSSHKGICVHTPSGKKFWLFIRMCGIENRLKAA